jgi:mevalonate kinase
MVRDLPAAVREPRVDAIGRATAAMREALRRRDLPAAGRLIDEAWESLAALGLSTPEADELIARVRAAGGHAKLCGACGGGVMLAWHPRPDRLEEAVRDAGYEPWRTELGAEGMRLEPEGGAVGGSDRARAARAPSKRQR